MRYKWQDLAQPLCSELVELVLSAKPMRHPYISTLTLLWQMMLLNWGQLFVAQVVPTLITLSSKDTYQISDREERTMCVLLCISVVVCVKEGACVCSSVLLTYAVPPAILNCSPQWLALWSKVTGSLFSLSLSSLPSVTPFLLLLTFLLFIYPVFFYVYVFAPSTPFVLTSNCPTLFMLWWLHCCLIVGHLIILKDELQNISVIPV